MICSFFGHHDCPISIKPKLLETIKKQIEQGVTEFYIGNHGNFDGMALSCLRELKRSRAEIHYAVILAYLPTDPNAYLPEETIFPEGIETVPKRFAIDLRNRWIVNHTDIIISYIDHSWGGAAKYVEKAKKRGATILNLIDN